MVRWRLRFKFYLRSTFSIGQDTAHHCRNTNVANALRHFDLHKLKEGKLCKDDPQPKFAFHYFLPTHDRMTNELNGILIKELDGVKSWQELKIRLEKYNTAQTETTTKKTQAGKIFELFTKYYLLTNPNYSEYTNVWLYDEVKPSIISELRLPPTDHGIDLILKTRIGDYHAVQCKFKNDERKSLSWTGDKIANIIALGINCSRQIVFTNVSEITEVATNLTDSLEKISLYELTSAPPEVFQNIFQLANGFKPKPISHVKEDPHQIEATRAVLQHFNTNNRGQLILPCGAGKTLVALWIKEGMRPKSTLVLVPSLALLRQIKDSWSFQRKVFYERLNVCSEKDIDKTKDTFNIHTYEVGGLVTTDSKDIYNFLQRDCEKVIFSTYQSLRAISEACKAIKGFEFDLTICDEAHRTAGSRQHNDFTLVHDDKNIPSKKRLYMTATPKVASANLKSLMGKDYELLCDMSKPEVFGTEAYRLTFGAAIQQKVLVDYKIIGIGVSDEDVEKFITERHYVGDLTADKIAHNFALDLVMRDYKAFHSLTFHSRVELAEKFAERHKTFFSDVFCNSVKGQQSTNERVRILNEFKDSEIGIVSNARCLTEGVDVPTIDLIYFSDPKNSKIDIVQASGRALRKDRTGKSKKEMGYIVVPIFHNANKNIEIEIKKKPIFNHLVEVVRSLCDQDERLQAEIDEVAFKQGKKTNSRIDFRFAGESIEKIIKLENIEEKIKHSLVHEIIQRNKDEWEVMYRTLQEYKGIHGVLNVSTRNSETAQLGRWVQEQRRAFRNNKLNPVRLTKLVKIGFDFRIEYQRETNDFDEVWKRNYKKLASYFNEHGNSDVRITYRKDNALKNWVVQQRVKFKQGRLEKWKIDELLKINFTLTPQNRGFRHELIDELKKYKEIHGDTLVPIFKQEGKQHYKLGRFVNKTRTIYNNGEIDKDGDYYYKGFGKLLREEVVALNELGFVWRVTEEWTAQYEKVKEYFMENGHSEIPQSFDPNLYNWCYRQKRSPSLTKEQIELLSLIEFDFTINAHKNRSVKKSFAQRIVDLRAFNSKYGNFEVPHTNQSLYNWLVEINNKFNSGILAKDRIQVLQELGYEFQGFANDDQAKEWDDMFLLLQEYKLKNGTLSVNATNEQQQELKRWVSRQREHFMKGTLSQFKLVSLSRLGLFTGKDFEKRELSIKTIKKEESPKTDKEWNNNIFKIRTYKAQFGNCDVPGGYDDNGLVKYVRALRARYKKGVLSAHQISQLDLLGFSWHVAKEQLNHKTWLKEYEKIKSFYLKNGHSLVRRGQADKKHYTWILMQRVKNKKNALTELQKRLLNEINFVWTVEDVPVKGRPDDKAWNKMFEGLREFTNKFGHARVSQTEKDQTYKKIGVWLNSQRVAYSRGKLLQKRKELLESLGVVWNAKDADWDNRFDQLLSFKNESGHFHVGQSDNNYKGLYNWIRNIRIRSELTEEQLQRLKAIDFPFEHNFIKLNNFEKRLIQLEEYRRINGTFTIKKKESQLYNWLLNIKKQPRLLKEQIEKLRQIGFTDFIPEKGK